MENWQFLIQKQGDRSWHSLESPSTEILEGRYRVLALSQLPNTDVEVRVTHFSQQETPPKRRIQKRLRRTNADGLMAVIPFTYLKPGIWELRCSGDLMSDMLGKSWQYGVYLRVSSQEAYESSFDPEPGSFHEPNSLFDSSSASNGFTEIAIATQGQVLATGFDQEALSDEPVSPVWVKGETAEQILQNLIDLALPTDPLVEEAKVEESPPEQPKCPLVLTLDRETYITRWGHVLTIHGDVKLPENYLGDEKLDQKNFDDLELRIELRSPQSLEVLTQIRQPLADQSLPFTVRSVIDIPAECESKLILADISLYGSISHPGEVILLASQSFTITADVTQLLAVTTTTNSSDDINTPSISIPEPSVSLDLELFNLVKTSPPGKSQLTHSEPNTGLLESIEALAIKKAVDSHGLQLPKLPEHQNNAVISQETVGESDLETSVITQDEITVPTTPAPINLEQLVIKNRRSRILGSSFPYLKRLPTLPTESEVANSEIDNELDIQVAENLPAIDLAILENTQNYASDYTNNTDESLREADILARSELVSTDNPEPQTLTTSELVSADNPEPQTLTTSELVSVDNPEPQTLTTSELVSADNPEPQTLTTSELVSVDNPEPQILATSEVSDDFVQETPNIPNLYSSPLIRKWIQSQGYSLPEMINPPSSAQEVLDQQITVSNQDALDQQITVNQLPDSSVVDETETFAVSADIASEIAETGTLVVEELDHQEYEPESSDLLPVPQLPPVEAIETPLAWLAQEIVVDDIFGEEEADFSKNSVSPAEKPSISSLSIPTSLSEELIEPLPIPQLHVPEGELIAGHSVRVRLELPKVPPQVVVKLWVEDCQTRWLLDGPHLLTDLLPNASGGMEVMFPLNIPFGCLEIRIEAIALNRATQQESHKVTVLRTVIPPDLPNLPLDELLGL